MKSITLLILLILCTFFTSTIAQDNIEGTDNMAGKNYLINSEILGEEREIQVFLPASYESSDTEYPVLYILDGQRLYLYGVSLLKSFTHFEQTPEFIVVGITNKYPDRFGHFNGPANSFQEFLTKDVINFVEDNFKTNDERLLFGWEFGGGFVIQTMMDNPALFDAHIAASPYPLSDANMTSSVARMKGLDDMLKRDTKSYLYFAVSENESVVGQGTDYLGDLLEIGNPPNIDWTYNKLRGEEHRSTPYATMYHGVKNYYHFYPALQFTTLEDFKSKGGLMNMYSYNLQRARLYGFSSELSGWTMFSTTRAAIRANDYDQFHLLVTEFSKHSFLGQIRLSRASPIAEFYLKHQKFDQAIEIFNYLSELHPESEIPLTGLGDVYTAQKDERKAAKYYKKAEALKMDAQKGN